MAAKSDSDITVADLLLYVAALLLAVGIVFCDTVPYKKKIDDIVKERNETGH